MIEVRAARSLLAGATILLAACGPSDGAKSATVGDSANAKAGVGRAPTAARRAPREYVKPSNEVLLRFLHDNMGPAPASLGTGVTVNTRSPTAANAAFLFLWGVSNFDPSYGPNGVSGNDTGSPNTGTRFGIHITPTPGRATLVDCDIAGISSLPWTVQIFNAKGEFIGEGQGGTVSKALDTGNHWTLVIPWDQQFAQSGSFRLMLAPNQAPYADLWGCSITPVL